MKLLIISHTRHYLSDAGIVGWGPTIREINYLAKYFESVTHVGTFYAGETAPASSMAYQGHNIRFVPIEPFGGDTLMQKLRILGEMSENLKIIRQELKNADVFQFRAPTGIGVYMIPYLLLQSKPGWFKYAGNWVQKNAPLGYAIQRWMLKTQRRFKVTINGHWPRQHEHCLSFENPCLEEFEREIGQNSIESKDYDGVLDFCFVGRLELAKGVANIVDAFVGWNHPRIGKIHLVGDGNEKTLFQSKTEGDDRFVFHGFLNRNQVGTLLAQCHVFLLPSQSEGFPKVIGEAANYGCVVVTTDVSCIGDYIKEGQTGSLIGENENNSARLRQVVEKLLNNRELKKMALSAHRMAHQFTYEYYLEHIRNSVLADIKVK